MNTKRKKREVKSQENFVDIQNSTRAGGKNRWMCNPPMPSRNIIMGMYKMYESCKKKMTIPCRGFKMRTLFLIETATGNFRRHQ